MVDAYQVWQCGQCMKTYATERSARYCCADMDVRFEHIRWNNVNIDVDIYLRVYGVVQFVVGGTLVDIPIFYNSDQGMHIYNIESFEPYNQSTSNKMIDLISSDLHPTQQQVKTLIEQGKVIYEN